MSIDELETEVVRLRERLAKGIMAILLMRMGDS